MNFRATLQRPAKLPPEAMRKSKPVRNPLVEEVVDNGVTTLCGPARVKGLLGKLLIRAASQPIVKRYELEEVGAFVWSQIDGKRTLESISKLLQSKYKMNRLEADSSLVAFVQLLAERGLITLLVKTGS